ncbi:TetR family transcriptional regulator [Mycobacteroides abscessus subsp. abscessus]|nr:TetR family transcriptional regulator [Mycobacteroides abscessus subsp. abscessus]
MTKVLTVNVGELRVNPAGGSVPTGIDKRPTDLALRLTSTFLVNPSDLLPTDTDTNTREFAIRYLLPLMRAAR